MQIVAYLIQHIPGIYIAGLNHLIGSTISLNICLSQPVSDDWHIKGREREMFYLTTHSTHFIYGYMASDIWLRTILIVRKETRCCHIGYSYQWTARLLLYAPSHRQDNTYHSLCYTSRGALAGTRNSSMDGISKAAVYALLDVKNCIYNMACY